MINNRQGGRRRGRGGQRTPGQGQGGQPGNRQDNRQRGNAAQLLEKYKSMARDSQLAGDRVQTEYYLQFADHYFRVLGENRPRSEDQRPRRGDDDLDDEDGDEEGGEIEGQESQDDQPDRSPSRERRPRFEADERPRQRTERFEADERPRQRAERFDADEPPRPRPERVESDDRPRQRTERRDEDEPEAREERPVRRKRANGGDALPLSALPPAIGRPDDSDEAAAPSSEEPAKPRRRARTVRPTDGDDGVAPVA